MKGTIFALLIVSWIIIGFIQWFAIVDALETWVGLPSVLAWIVSVFVAYLPIISTVLTIIGAVKIWHWSLLVALALFLTPYAIGAFGLATGSWDEE